MSGKNCAECKHHEVWSNDPNSPSHWMCVAPAVVLLLDESNGYQNQAVRCNEARDFKVVCGHTARFFEPKV